MIEIKRLYEITPEVATVFINLMSQLTPDSQILEVQYLQKIIDNENIYVFVACNPEIIGTLTLALVSTPSGTKAWIEDVVVDALARKQGVGKKLLLHAIDFATELSVSSINLTSKPERIAANKLYQEMGFVLRETNVYRLAIN
ncbi:MAG: GNAT family N-acetyltransferase [Dysgonomonas sp.]